eukprot:365121-Chlamydomonas_euryale.AAC.4
MPAVVCTCAPLLMPRDLAALPPARLHILPSQRRAAERCARTEKGGGGSAEGGAWGMCISV